MPGPVTVWVGTVVLVMIFAAVDPSPPGEVSRAIVVGCLLLGGIIAYGCHAIVKALKQERNY